MSTRPEAGSPDELVWLRGFEEGRNYVFQIHNEFLNGPYFQVQKEVHGLREENARLREALEAVASYYGKTNLHSCCVDRTCRPIWEYGQVVDHCAFRFGVNRGFNECAGIARAALEKK